MLTEFVLKRNKTSKAVSTEISQLAKYPRQLTGAQKEWDFLKVFIAY